MSVGKVLDEMDRKIHVPDRLTHASTRDEELCGAHVAARFGYSIEITAPQVEFLNKVLQQIRVFLKQVMENLVIDGEFDAWGPCDVTVDYDGSAGCIEGAIRTSFKWRIGQLKFGSLAGLGCLHPLGNPVLLPRLGDEFDDLVANLRNGHPIG